MAVPVIQTQNPGLPDSMKRPIPDIDESKLTKPGMPRFNQAADVKHPQGTPGSSETRSVLQAHVDYFDTNKDGIISIPETYRGFRNIGFNPVLSVMAVCVIHFGFCLYLNDGPFPIVDPFLRLWTSKMHKAKHGSDSMIFDYQGRFRPQRFEELFAQYTSPQHPDALSWPQIWQMVSDWNSGFDFFGIFAARFEWFATYWCLSQSPESYVYQGTRYITREQIRGVYDGSFFYRQEAALKKLKSQ